MRRITRYCCTVCAGCLLLQAQQDPKALLTRARQRVLASLDRMPNYMCTQTIDRAQYEPDKFIHVSSCKQRMTWRTRGLKQVLATSDRLRLDVGMADNREIYSWVGENRFRNRTLSDLVGEGAISNGSFGAFLKMIFRSDVENFAYKRRFAQAGRMLAEFHFRVPVQKSHYSFSNRKERTMIAYEGTFLVDQNTGDLVWLAVNGQPPANSETCELTTTMDYKRVRLNGSDFLLPSKTDLNIVDLDGYEFDNHAVYSACHEFLGESTLTFGTLPEPKPEARVAAAAGLPPGIPFTVALAQDIDTAVAATGDPITARLTSTIRDQSSKILAPEGATIHGRILRLRRFYRRSAFFVLAVKLETLEAAGMARPFSATVSASDPDSSAGAGFTVGSWDLGPTTTPTDRGVAVFQFQLITENPVIRAGLPSKWVTVAPLDER